MPSGGHAPGVTDLIVKYMANRAAKNISSLESQTMVPTDTMFGLVREPLAGSLSSTEALATARSVPLHPHTYAAGRAGGDHQGERALVDPA